MSQFRIAYCSDLHLEFELDSRSKIANGLIENGIRNSCDADVLILAGDIVPTSNIMSGECDTFFDTVNREFRDVVYIFGNHEYYHGYFYEDVETIKNYLKRWENIHILDKNSIEIQGIFFFGATLWTNMNREDPLLVYGARMSMSDYKYIRTNEEDGLTILADDTIRAHKETLVALKEFLSTGKQCVVVTHHAPSFQSVHSKYKDDQNNFYYYSDLDYLMYDYENISRWIHGHMHDKFDYVINNTRVMCNPRGYVGHERIVDTFNLTFTDIER